MGRSTDGIRSCLGCGDRADVIDPNITASLEFARSVPPYPTGKYFGRGVVIVGGGKYWDSTYVTVRMLRHVGCTLPIRVYYLGEAERDDRYAKLLAPLKACVLDLTTIPEAAEVRSLTGFGGQAPFEAKSFAVLHSPFEEVLSLDADCYAAADPTKLFDCPRYALTGGVFWPDLPATEAWTKWTDWGVDRFGPHCGWEVGQYVIHKRLAWRQLNMARWYDDHGDWCYGGSAHHDHGDKCARAAWAVFRTEPTFYTTRVAWRSVAFVQPGPDGQTPLFIHRVRSKFTLKPTKFVSTTQNGTNIRGRLPMETEAFGYLEELREALSRA